MRHYRVLILTDHSTHPENNSLYGLVNTLYKDTRCQLAFVASRGAQQNNKFFQIATSSELYGKEINRNITFEITMH